MVCLGSSRGAAGDVWGDIRGGIGNKRNHPSVLRVNDNRKQYHQTAIFLKQSTNEIKYQQNSHVIVHFRLTPYRKSNDKN